MEKIKEVWDKLAVACILALFVLFFLEVSYTWTGAARQLLRSLAIFSVGVLAIDLTYGVLLAENKKRYLLRSFAAVGAFIPTGTSFRKIEEKPKKTYACKPKPRKKDLMAYRIASLHKK